MRQLPRHPVQVPLRASARITTIATLFSALVLSAGARPAAAQAPGTSNGTASTYPVGITGPGACTQSYFAQPAGTASCNGATSTTSVTAATSSTNATRIASAQTTASMTGSSGDPVAQASSTQFGQVLVSGTGGSPTSLVYHFNTTSGTSLSGATQQGSFGSWSLYFDSSQQGNDTFSYVDGEHNWNDASTVLLFGSNGLVTATGTGYNFKAPFDPNAGTVTFDFNPSASAANYNEVNASSWASIMAMLSSIDAVNAQGQTVGTVVFGADGNGTLDLGGSTSTVPEPGELALLATGLVALAPIARRSRAVG